MSGACPQGHSFCTRCCGSCSIAYKVVVHDDCHNTAHVLLKQHRRALPLGGCRLYACLLVMRWNFATGGLATLLSSPGFGYGRHQRSKNNKQQKTFALIQFDAFRPLNVQGPSWREDCPFIASPLLRFLSSVRSCQLTIKKNPQSTILQAERRSAATQTHEAKKKKSFLLHIS